MTIQHDAKHDDHNGSGKTPGQTAGEPFAKSVKAGEDAVQKAADGVASESKAALSGLLAGSREWMGWAQDAGQANLEAWHSLLGCRSPQAAIAIHGALIQKQFELMAYNGRRMATAGWTTALKATDKLA